MERAERRMPIPSPSEVPTISRQATRRTEAPQRFDYEIHTARVKDRLHEWQFGQSITHFETQGLNKTQYITWAKEKLFGKDHTGPSLPEKIGEVEVPAIIRENAGNMQAILASYNVGYGHYRTALVMENLLQLMGAPTTNIFIAGPDKVFDATKGVLAKILVRDIDRIARGMTTNYIKASKEDAYRQGLIAEPPTHHDPDPQYSRRAQILTGLAMGTWRERFTWQLGNAAKRIFELHDQTPGQVKSSLHTYRLLFLKSIKHFLRTTISSAANGEDMKTLVIATHGPTANVLGLIPKEMKQELGIIDANFQPDIGMILGSYSSSPPTYTEKDVTTLKWGMKLGVPDQAHAPNTHVLNGYFSPLSVFARNELSTMRSDAAKNGTPITVIATASGVATTQIEAFKDFIKEHAEELRAGTLRYVVQCGNEANGGPDVYKELGQLIRENGVDANVLLHLAPTEKAALEFFEALSWAPVPLAIQTKGAEVARMAQALNIPHIPTGTVGGGGHEIWNIAASIFDNPNSVVFPNQKVSDVFIEDVRTKFANDPIVQRYSDRYHPEQLISLVAQHTATTPEDMTIKVREYIESGYQHPTNQSAMLDVIAHMLSRSN